jgi:hypothetical protein
MFTKRFALTRLAFLSRFTGFGGVTHRRAMQTVVALGASILFTAVSLPLRAQGGPTVTFQAPLPFPSGTNPIGPTGMAFDHSGNLFMSDFSNGRVIELPPGCASTSCETVVPYLNIAEPIDVALDAAGDLSSRISRRTGSGASGRSYQHGACGYRVGRAERTCSRFGWRSMGRGFRKQHHSRGPLDRHEFWPASYGGQLAGWRVRGGA